MLVSGVAAASSGALSNVLKGTSKFIINQVDKTPANNVFYNGTKNVPSSLVYEGTTYIPIRMVSNMLDIPIQWDGKNQAVLVGTSVYSGKYLTDLAPSYKTNNVYVNSDEVTISEQKYTKTLKFKSNLKKSYEIHYDLNSQYSELTFMYSSISGEGYFEIFDENDNLLWTAYAVRNVGMNDVTIDMTGMLTLKIKYTDTLNVQDGWAGAPVLYSGIANPLLK